MRWRRTYADPLNEMRRRQGWNPGKSTIAELVGFGGVWALILASVVGTLRGHYWAPVWILLGAGALWFLVVRVQYQRMGPRRKQR